MSLFRVRRGYVTLGLPSTFSGINKTARYHKIPSKKAEHSLSHIKTYQLHKAHRAPKYRNPFFTYIQNEYFQMDLIDLAFLGRFNGGHKFILTGIDTFSRKAYAIPLKNKKAATTANAIEQFFVPLVPKIRSFISDNGTEFKNRIVREMLERNNMKFYYTNSELKVALCESFNKTIQKYIFQHNTQYNTKRYIDKLPSFLQSYNDSKHSFFNHQLSPNEATLDENKIQVLDYHNRHYMKVIGKKRLKKFKIGDKVRIKKWTTPFTKGYRSKWTDEIFQVVEENNHLPIPMYKIASTGNGPFAANLGEPPIGSFYSNELALDNTT